MLGVGQHRRLLCARIFQIEQMRNTGALFLGAALRVAIVVDAICASTSSTDQCETASRRGVRDQKNFRIEDLFSKDTDFRLSNVTIVALDHRDKSAYWHAKREVLSERINCNWCMYCRYVLQE